MEREQLLRGTPASLEQGALNEATQLMADYGSEVCGEQE